MAREFARINMGIWQDEEFRALPPLNQHLYFVLWTHPTLSYCGVLDYRPGRIAAMAGGWTAGDVRRGVEALCRGLFVAVDEDTEELLVRSWIRHDGLLKQPRMAVSLANAYATVASARLRGVVAHEVQKVHSHDPALACWAKPTVAQLLKAPTVEPASLGGVSGSPSPAVGGGFGPGFGSGLAQTLPSVSVPPTPAPTPTPSLLLLKTSPADAGTPTSKRGTRIPDPFPITAEMVAWARENTPGLDHRAVTEAFADYWRAIPGARGVKLDWVAVWRNWLRKESERHPGGRARPAPMDRLAQTVALGEQMQADLERTQLGAR